MGRLKVNNIFYSILAAIGYAVAVLVILLVYALLALASLIGRHIEARDANT